MRQATNSILVAPDEKILLSMKKRGFGVGKWNGAGGKVDTDETVEETAVREIIEEVGVEVKLSDLEKVAEINYSNADPKWGMFVTVFVVRKWLGEPTETEEMRPAWFDPKDIPFDQAWPDMKHWLPRVLAGEKLRADFLYKPDGESIEKFEVGEVRDFY